MNNPPNPAASYREELTRIDSEIERLSARESSRAWWRLALFIVFVVAAWLAFVEGLFSGWLTLIPLAAFIFLVAGHSKASAATRRLRRLRLFSAQGLARVERDWDQIREVEIDVPDDHLYQDDLDLFGRASLFSLISVCTTRAGVSTLAGWLLAPAERTEITERQAAAAELASRGQLRKDLFINGEGEIADLDIDSLAANDDVAVPPAALPLAAAILGVANIVTLIGWLATDMSRLWFLLSALISIGFAFAVSRYKTALSGMDGRSQGLRTMLGFLERLESESFESDKLREIARVLIGGDSSAIDGIRGLSRLVSLHDYQRNQMFYPIALLLLWETQIAFAVARWRRRYGTHGDEWIRAVGELEALLSLAAFRADNPDYEDPAIVDSDELRVELVDGGHPMIPADDVVRNSITIDPSRRLYIVSGSNMSGKSTMLRTVGSNCVLALAGAVVSAARLSLSPLTVAASIQVRDSIEEGRSRFYAEILRLRAISETAAREHRVLFLLDEVLHGTNSHDRRIGAAAVLESLLDSGASGMVTTHDLALAEIAAQLDGATNVHFEDRIENDEMIFEYEMKPGVVTRSNAIQLMRRIGLDV